LSDRNTDNISLAATDDGQLHLTDTRTDLTVDMTNLVINSPGGDITVGDLSSTRLRNVVIALGQHDPTRHEHDTVTLTGTPADDRFFITSYLNQDKKQTIA